MTKSLKSDLIQELLIPTQEQLLLLHPFRVLREHAPFNTHHHIRIIRELMGSLFYIVLAYKNWKQKSFQIKTEKKQKSRKEKFDQRPITPLLLFLYYIHIHSYLIQDKLPWHRTCPFRFSSFSRSSILALYRRVSAWSWSWAWKDRTTMQEYRKCQATLQCPFIGNSKCTNSQTFKVQFYSRIAQ